MAGGGLVGVCYGTGRGLRCELHTETHELLIQLGLCIEPTNTTTVDFFVFVVSEFE
jgi:hypothetical protein